MKDVLSATPDFSLQKTGQSTKISVHTDINNGQIGMVQSCQDIDRSPFLEEIQHHLAGDFLGICTDSFSHDAVIGGKHIGSLVQRPAKVAFTASHQSSWNVL